MVRDSSDARERRDESVGALRERDMLADVWCPAEIRENDDRWAIVAADELQRRLRSVDCPTAVLTDNNGSALGLLRELARRGLRAPKHISMCAVASDADIAFEGRRLTCCRFDFRGMGRKAIDLLAQRCLKPGLDKPHVHRIGFEFVEGETVGRVSPS